MGLEQAYVRQCIGPVVKGKSSILMLPKREKTSLGPSLTAFYSTTPHSLHRSGPLIFGSDWLCSLSTIEARDHDTTQSTVHELERAATHALE
jgi:hypothetical protein